jgi:predicted RNA-binding Zn ribbon-like protein
MTSDRPPAIFVGEHLALDFLNTTAKPSGVLIDWLADGDDLVCWLEQARAIEPAAATKIRGLGHETLDEVAREARRFRKWLREFVTTRMGKPLRPTSAAVAPLNAMLARNKTIQRVEAAKHDAAGGQPLRLRRIQPGKDPEELLDPITEAAADLICNHDFRLIRACEGSGCILLFLDRTKSHARRWCSMAVCGNRAKAAAHRARRARNEKRDRDRR